jgi:hypothetical protein
MQKTNILGVNKNDDLGTTVLLKCFYEIEAFAPELSSIKSQIFTNKKLYMRLKNDYFSTEVLQTYKRMKEIISENKDSEIKADPNILLANNNGFRIKKIIKEAYCHYFNNKDVQEFFFSFLIPNCELLDYNCKVSSLKFAIKEYEMLSKEEIECHYISYLIRADNFKKVNDLLKKLEKVMTSKSINLKTLLNDTCKGLEKNNKDETLFLIKTKVQFKNYESIILKKKLLP